MGAPPPPRKAKPAAGRPLAWGSEDVGPSASRVTPVKALSPLILSFFVSLFIEASGLFLAVELFSFQRNSLGPTFACI